MVINIDMSLLVKTLMLDLIQIYLRKLYIMDTPCTQSLQEQQHFCQGMAEWVISFQRTKEAAMVSISLILYDTMGCKMA